MSFHINNLRAHISVLGSAGEWGSEPPAYLKINSPKLRIQRMKILLCRFSNYQKKIPASYVKGTVYRFLFVLLLSGTVPVAFAQTSSPSRTHLLQPDGNRSRRLLERFCSLPHERSLQPEHLFFTRRSELGRHHRRAVRRFRPR